MSLNYRVPCLTSSISCGAMRRQLHAIVERSRHDAGEPPRSLSKGRRHFVGLRRGRFFAAADLMMRLPFPLDGNGILA